VPIAIALTLVAAASIAAPVPAAAAGRAAYGHRTAPTRTSTDPVSVIVRYRAGLGAAQRAAARQRAGVVAAGASRVTRSELVRPADGQTVDETVAALRADPAVASAEPAYQRSLASDPAADPYVRPYQWGLENRGPGCVPGYLEPCTADVDIDAQDAWPHATGAGITVAVLDDGLDFTHPDLAGQAWVNPGESGDDGLGGNRATNGIDDDGNGYVDDVNGVNLCAAAGPTTELHQAGQDWHGTGVASVIAAAANGVGMVGVAPDARLMAVRWLVSPNVNSGPYASCSNDVVAAEAIHYAVDMGADIINASWGGEGITSELADAIAYADSHGVLFVAAAGNEGSSSLFYPAASTSPNVISVGAIDPDGSRSTFSNYGSWVDVAAPGSWILGAFVIPGDPGCPGTYCYLDGTSFAAPHVAGIAALAAQAKPSLLGAASQLRSKLIYSGWKSGRLGGLVASSRVADAGYAVDVTPPSLGWFTARARSGSTLGSSTVSTSLSWAAAADDTGIEYYRVRYRRAGTPSWTTLTSSTTGRSSTVTLATSRTYEIELLARDHGANTSVTVLPVTPTVYQESSSRFTWGGTWGTSTSSSFSGGKARFTGTAGRWARFAVSGRSVSLVAAKGPTRGAANVYVDGVWKATINLYASKARYRSVVFTTAWATSGSHTLKVVAKGTGTHRRVDVDAVVVNR
jgi:subtilisin family serine protease